MILFPEVQQKAQAELDAVVGRDRLADSSDEESLPYTSAVVKEVLRWKPALPSGLPHRVSEDDVYNGMRIPKGSWIFGSSWYVGRRNRYSHIC
jgi:cytochrome P450